MQLIPDNCLITQKSGSGWRISHFTQTAPHLNYTKYSQLAIQADGLQSLLDMVRAEMKTAKNGKESATRSTGGSFYFFKSYSDAMDTYVNTPEAVRNFNENDVKLTGGDAAGLELVYDVTGDFLDVSRYLDGEPEMFGSMTNGNPRGKRANITLSIDWRAGTSTEYINERSKRVIRLVDWLESQGIRTQVTVVLSNECIHMELIVKQHHEPLELNDIAVVSHSDFLRRIGFRMDEHSKTWQSGYGSAVAFNDAVRSYTNTLLKSEFLDEIDLFVGSGTSHVIDDQFDGLEEYLTTLLEADERVERVLTVLL